jgi:hypothetical protein
MGDLGPEEAGRGALITTSRIALPAGWMLALEGAGVFRVNRPCCDSDARHLSLSVPGSRRKEIYQLDL